MTLPVSDHVEAVTWGYAGGTGGMYVICIWGCATDGGFGKTHNFEKIVSRVTISYL